MSSKIFLTIMLTIFLASCATTVPKGPPLQKEVIVKIEMSDLKKVEDKNGHVSKDDQNGHNGTNGTNGTNGKNGVKVVRSMMVPHQEGTLSRMSFTLKDEAYIKIFSSLTVGDVSNLWNDINVLYNSTNIRKVNLFINSPGGDAFSGLALADQIERARRKGFYITAHASGVVASAAVPVFVVADRRLAAPGTIFMVHETSIWKWPGRETSSDIRSQNRLMSLLRDRYIGKLAYYSKLSKTEWEDLENKTTWFSAEQAKKWGIVDEIE